MSAPLPVSSTKDMWTNMGLLTEINKRHDIELEEFPPECFQINPFSKNAYSFVTGKVGEKPPTEYECPEDIPGFWRLKAFYDMAFLLPMQKCYQGGPATEYQRYGWFPQVTTPEDYDERFNYKIKTADFIKTEILIQGYDRAMKAMDAYKL